MKRKEQLKKAQQRYRVRQQSGCSRINLFISEEAHQALKENAAKLGLTQACYLEQCLLHEIPTQVTTRYEAKVLDRQEGQGVALNLTAGREESTFLIAKIQEMEKELARKNYWIARLTAVNAALTS